MSSTARQGVWFCLFIASLAILTWQAQHNGGIATLLVRPPKAVVGATIKPQYDQWSLTTVTSAYRAYERSTEAETQRMRTAYSKLGSTHLDIVERTSLDYPAKLQRLDEATAINSVITTSIVELAVRELGVNGSEVEKRDGGSLFRIREALLHFVRDWSEEGAEEREVIHRPILDVLRGVPVSERGMMRVLVPGSGLGRLAWEISQLGKSKPKVTQVPC